MPSDEYSISYGGTTGTAYKNSYGLDSRVTYMGILGIHMIDDINGKALRFSSSDHFDTHILTQSIYEDPILLKAFQDMLERLKDDPDNLTRWKFGLDKDYFDITPYMSTNTT
ncbi:hypothetical protein ACFSW8_00040 [Rubritalea tangerina]|uniref:Uncharacterized protein n=2 Tax=Rubritalea tangerina TaxID=430798 RepID=A0ABW4Z601_9BACT